MIRQPFTNPLLVSPTTLEATSVFGSPDNLLSAPKFADFDEDEQSTDSLESLLFDREREMVGESASVSTPVTSNRSRRRIPDCDEYVSLCPRVTLPPDFSSNNYNVPSNTRKVLFSSHVDGGIQPTRISDAVPCPVHLSPASTRSEAQNIPLVVAVAAPSSPKGCSVQCLRKDREIRRQAKEIEQLKSLVTQMVCLLGDTLKPDDTKASSVSGTTLQEPECSPLPVERNFDEHVLCESESSLWDSLPEPMSSFPFCPSLSEESSTPSEPNSPIVVTKQRRSSFLRLCQMKAQKFEEIAASDQCTSQSNVASKGRYRHVLVSVAGKLGYYSGPEIEPDSPLRGCVVRFEDGDQFLGDLRSFDQCNQESLSLHGRGTLYRKDGSIVRGLFHRNRHIT